MASTFSPELLSAYLGSAAERVLTGRGLTDRSLWAIAQAREQLQLEIDEIAGSEPAVVGAARAALIARPEGDSETLGDILVASVSAESVGEVLDELDALARSEAEAATRLKARLVPAAT